MEKTIENKARFFALYWGQPIAVVTKGSYTYPLGLTHLVDKNTISSVESEKYTKHRYSLELKPLSSISDEDALKICEIHFIQNGINFNIKNLDTIKIEANPIPSKCNSVYIEVIYNHSWGKELERIFIYSNRKTNSSIVDKIRELGYAFSFNMLSVEKQIEYGWIKLKQ